MTKAERPLLEGIRNEVGSLAAELGEMLALRWRLARLELQSDLHSGKRLAIVLLPATIAALTSLPVLVVFLAAVLDQRLGIPQSGWLLIFGLGLLLGAMLAGYLAWRRFRRRLVGLEETLDELREDIVWLREWTTRDEQGNSKER